MSPRETATRARWRRRSNRGATGAGGVAARARIRLKTYIGFVLGGILILTTRATLADAKIASGTVTLDSENTEAMLSKFSVSKNGGNVNLKLSTAKTGWERGSHELELLVMNEDEYFKWKAMLKKGSLCRDRNELCSRKSRIDLPHPSATHKARGYEFFIDPASGDSYRLDLATGNTTWMHPHQHRGATSKISHRETRVNVAVKETKTSKSRTKEFEYGVTSNWFVVLSDCALEFYPTKPPALHYDLEMKNDRKHLPQEMVGLGFIYGLAWTGMAIALAVFGVLAYQQYEVSRTIHALVLVVIFAHLCQLSALGFEWMHITVFSINGKGLRWRYTWFAADFASDMLQGFSEFLVEFVLLFLVCGWTTLSMTLGGLGGSLFASLESGGGGAGHQPVPPGVSERQSTRSMLASVLKTFFKVNADDPAVKYRIDLMAAALRSPVNMLRRGADTSIGVFLLVFFAGVHLLLELASRQYNEDFEVFHDHDHWPGFALVFMRIAFAILFIVAGSATYATAKQRDPALASFIQNLLVIGAVWLLAFPFVIFTAQSVSLIWRQRYVAGACACLQCAALSALGVLVLVDGSFKKLSSVSAAEASVSGAQVSRQKLGHRGFRAKVAID
jgi:hypothetical protein